MAERPKPLTVPEHRAAYQHHKARADMLKVRIDDGLVEGMDGEHHRALAEEYHDELICAAKHFTLAAVIEEMTT
jgi:hypothetical protein